MEPKDNRQAFEALDASLSKSRLVAWIDGLDSVEQGPWLLYLSPTNYCNLRCTVCARHIGMRKERGFMSLETLDRVLVNLPPTIRKVYVQKQGEPTLHPQIGELITHVRSMLPEANIAMHTNALRLDAALSATLIGLLDHISVSISGVSEETYAAAHGKAAFAKACDGLKTLLAARRKALAKGGKATAHIAIDYVRQQANREETDDTVVAFFRDTFDGLDSVDIHWTDSFQGLISEATIGATQHCAPEKRPRCLFPWNALTVLHDGELDYCFVEPKENIRFGNLAERPFRELYNGDAFRRFRRMMVEGKLEDLAKDGFGCHDCSWLWSSQAQRPRHLSHGSNMTADSETPAPALDVWELAYRGLANLAAGELSAAMGWLLWAQTANPEPVLEARLSHWENSIRKGMALSWPRDDWREAMAKAGWSPEAMETHYYRLRDD